MCYAKLRLGIYYLRKWGTIFSFQSMPDLDFAEDFAVNYKQSLINNRYLCAEKKNNSILQNIHLQPAYTFSIIKKIIPTAALPNYSTREISENYER